LAMASFFAWCCSVVKLNSATGYVLPWHSGICAQIAGQGELAQPGHGFWSR
jgi:hypothetical protein